MSDTVGQMTDCRAVGLSDHCRTTVGPLSDKCRTLSNKFDSEGLLVVWPDTVGHCRTLSDTVGLSDYLTTVGPLSESAVGQLVLSRLLVYA